MGEGSPIGGGGGGGDGDGDGDGASEKATFGSNETNKEVDRCRTGGRENRERERVGEKIGGDK